jgi:transcriptional regulator with XRE-family HTH domain
MGNIVALLLDDAMPPRRLGVLLRAARKRRGWKRKEAAVHAGTTAEKLRAYERGMRRIPAEVCTRLAECYGDDLLAHIPQRDPLDVSTLTAVSGEDETLTDFVQLVRRLRRAKPGEPLPLRATDVAALASALDADPETIEQRIVDVLGCSREEARALHRELLRRRVVLPVAGLAASVVAIAGVQAAHAATDRPARPAVTPVEVSAAPANDITTAPTTFAVPRTTPPTSTTPTTRSVPEPTPSRAMHVVPPPAPLNVPKPLPGGWYPLPENPPTDNVTPPSIEPDDTPVGVLPGETPITDIGTAISSVPDQES